MQLKLFFKLIYLFSRCDVSFGMVAEVIPPMLSMKEANAPDEPDSDYVEKQEKQMGSSKL